MRIGSVRKKMNLTAGIQNNCLFVIGSSITKELFLNSYWILTPGISYISVLPKHSLISFTLSFIYPGDWSGPERIPV